MLLIGINELRPGLRVRAAVVHPTAPDRPLLRPGAVLAEPIIASLARHGVRQVWVEHTQTDDLDDTVSPDLFRARLDVHAAFKNDMPRLATHPLAAEQLSAYRHAIVELVRRTEAARPHAGIAEPLYDGEAVPASHCANTAYLAILIGLKLGGYVVRERRGLSARQGGNLVNLGLGAMLHDVGKLQLDAASAMRHEATEPVEMQDASPYSDHPDLGYEVVTGADVPATVRHIVRCHHHRDDGTGWPDQDAAPRVSIDDPAAHRPHVFTRIVSAANVLDTLMHDADGVRRPVVAALSDFASPRFDGWFDPIVRRVVLRRLPPFAIGSHVELSDGRSAVVIAANSRQPCRPTVRTLDDTGTTAPMVLQLTEQSEVCIKSCVGEPVGRWLFDLPRAGAAEPPSEAA
jgi:HD-GYP domain-containing protein (c-di-GMP phosphodiesterase class II)